MNCRKNDPSEGGLGGSFDPIPVIGTNYACTALDATHLPMTRECHPVG